MIHWFCGKNKGIKGFGFVLFASLVMLGMGTGEKKTNEIIEPGYSPLEDGQERFSGVLQTDDTKTTLQDLSFTGTTKLTGLRRENDKSYNDVDLFVVSKIVVKDSDYRSAEHSNAPGEPLFIKAEVTFNSGVTEEYLLPHKLEVSGVESNTGVEKTWRLRNIKELVVQEKMQTPEEAPLSYEEEPVTEPQETGIMSKIVGSVKRAGNYIKSSLS